MAFVGSVGGRAPGPPGEAASRAARLLEALLRENHLRAADVVAAVVRGPGGADELAAALRGAGVRGVPVFASPADVLELELHVRLRRRRRLRSVEVA